MPTLDIAHFVCKSNVQYLDLSYNDITFIRFIADGSCSSKLKYLNLDHNMIASYNPAAIAMMPLIIIISSLETLSSVTSDSPIYQDGLWNDENDNRNLRIQELGMADDVLSPVAHLFYATPLPFLVAKYMFWLKDVLHNCGGFSSIDFVTCYVQAGEDLCKAFHCLSPSFSIENCPKDMGFQIFYFAQKMCNYTSCFMNMPFPMPPKLNSVRLQNSGKYNKLLDEIYIEFDNLTTLCIHPHNNMEYI